MRLCLLLAAVELVSTDKSKAADVTKAVLPRITYLGLRCSDRPIDLHPGFEATHYLYTATLDYADGSFAVDALLETDNDDLELVNAADLQTTRQIDPGDTHRFTVTVRDRRSSATTPYTITVIRLDGSGLRLKALEVTPRASVSLSPVFDPDVLQYNIRLSAAQEYVVFRIVPWDTGQTIETQSLPADFVELMTTTTTFMPILTTPAVTAMPPDLIPQEPVAEISSPSPSSRRLQSICGDGCVPEVPSGEAQYSVIKRRFPVDMHSSRLITIRVRPANGDPTAAQVYRLQTTREPCPATRPLYSPDIQDCTMTCNVGRFVNGNRCALCSRHCLDCIGWDSCVRCEASDWRKLRFVRSVGGFCKVVLVPWRAVALVSAAVVILVAVCCCVWRTVRATSHQSDAKQGKRMRSERLLRKPNGGGADFFEQSDDD